jgi:hypothetical protein
VRYCRPIKTSTRGETQAPTNLSPHSRSLFRAPHHSSEATTGPAMGGGGRHHRRPPRRRTRPPSSGSLVGPTHVRALTDPEVTTVLQLAATTTGSSTSGRRSSRARSGKWRLGIYPHGVWIRPQPAVVVMEISTPR